jgi:citrate lyase beta subunit
MNGLGHFTFLPAAEREQLFQVDPGPVTRESPRLVIADALGATLYSPATRPDLVGDLRRTRADGLVSSVVCLEDSIADDQVADALDHVVDQLGALHDAVDEVPFVFVRVRASEQITDIVERLGTRSAALAGFVVPKFTADTGAEAIARVRKAAASAGQPLWVMPVVETPEVAHRETRTRELLGIDQLLAENSDITLAVRIGATDIAGAYGLRRPRELTVYDVRVVADAITDIVNVLGRIGREERVITGAVWEYFAGPERIFKPQLRETPFGSEERALRAGLIAAELDGLIREVVLDRANGIAGKTVIHPTHVPVVHALSVVSGEDYADALAVLGKGSGGGVVKSLYRNKMNESRPHRVWAKRTLRRAAAFGVARDGVTFADLLAAVHCA